MNLFNSITLLTSFFTISSLKECKQKKSIQSTYNYTKPTQFSDSIRTDNLASVGINTKTITELTNLILVDSFPNIHSLLIAKDGKLVYENYFAGNDEISGKKLGKVEHTIDDLHDCRSISKSVTSACIGIAIKQGLIKSVDDPIFIYLKEYEKLFDAKKKEITIRNLLTMTSGLEWDESISYRDFRNSELRMDLSGNPIKFILSQKVVADTGTTWNYNGGNTQLLAEILKNVSGTTLDKFAEKNLFLPLGIKNYQWLSLTKNMPAAASGLRLRSRDFLKFGLLFMNKGKWGDEEILPKYWTQTSLSTLVNRPNGTSKNDGYGYQFWTYTETINNKEIAIQEARGNGGQRIFFVKSLNLLVVITAGNYNQWDIINNSHKALVAYIIPSLK